MKKVGFIGLGAIGLPMAKNLLKQAAPLEVFDVVKAPVEELVEIGASAATSSKEVAEMSEVVIVIVPGAPDVKEVVLGKNGVIKGIREGQTIIIMSTVEPGVMKHLRKVLDQTKKGIKLLDAPVARGQQSAIEGTLGIMVGGDESVLEDCREILQAMGSDIWHCGELGMGQTMKIVSNYLSLNIALLINEAMVLGVKCGAKPEKLAEVQIASAGNSWMLENFWAPRVLKGNFSPGMRLDLAIKDIGIAVSIAKELKVPVPVGSLCHKIYKAESAAGKGNLSFLASVTTLEEAAGVKVRSEGAK